jgi:AraC-like DNA-binding protein
MRTAIVTPAQTRPVIGIRFRPGEAARLLPAAPRELTDDATALTDLWGDDALPLQDALDALLDRAARRRLGPDSILQLASAHLEMALRRRLGSHGEAVDRQVRAAASLLERGISVREVAARVALSERQLARRFTDRVGIPPKTFARVMRLQRAAGRLAAGALPAEAAMLAGYADQAHFTRDARELAGITPRGLARELSDSFNTPLAAAI